MSSSFPILHGADVALTIAICLIVVGGFVWAIVRSNRPDPKMALLLELMRDFPGDESEGTGRCSEAKDSQSQQDPARVSREMWQQPDVHAGEGSKEGSS